MNKNFCVRCKSSDVPPCIISQKPVNYNLDSILLNLSKYSYIELFTCPVNSQIYRDNKLIITDDCIECGICINRCTYVNNKPISVVIKNDKKILTSLSYLRLYLETQINDLDFYDEVPSEGHSRSKRIDVLGINEEKVFLFKALTNLNKIEYYIRSYQDIIQKHSERLEKYSVSIVIIVPKNLNKTNIFNSYDDNIHVIELENVHNLIRGAL